MKLKCVYVYSKAAPFTFGKTYEVIRFYKTCFVSSVNGYDIIDDEGNIRRVALTNFAVRFEVVEDFEIKLDELNKEKERKNLTCVSGLEAIDLMKTNGITMQSASEDSIYLYKVENGKVLWTTIYDTNNWKEDTQFDFTDTYILYTPKKSSVWHNHGEGDFYTIYSGGVVELEDCCLEDDYTDEDRFSTLDKAEKIEFQQRLFRKLQRFSDENGGNEIDWNNFEEPKFRIGYSLADKDLIVIRVYTIKSQGCVYFTSEKNAKKAIELFHDDLIKYFTM